MSVRNYSKLHMISQNTFSLVMIQKNLAQIALNHLRILKNIHLHVLLVHQFTTKSAQISRVYQADVGNLLFGYVQLVKVKPTLLMTL